MKKGFTMIELIFVIVILGILAAVAIPRLAATRDDAEISKAATNVATAVSDITSYYTAQGDFAATVPEMTNVPLDAAKGSNAANVTSPKHAALKVKKEDVCITFTVGTAGQEVANKVKVGDPVLVVTGNDSSTDAACKGVVSAVKKIIESSPIRLGGSGVNFEGPAATTPSRP